MFGAGVFWSCMLTVPLVQICWDVLAWQVWYVYSRMLDARSPSVRLESAYPTVSLASFLSPLHLSTAENIKIFAAQQIPSFVIQKHYKRMAAMTTSACVLLFYLSCTCLSSASEVTFVGIEYSSTDSHPQAYWPFTPDAAFTHNTLTTCANKSACRLPIPRRMKSPISIYYDIGPFYENDLDFVKTTDYADNSFATDIAYRTFFNDTFDIKHADIHEGAIAWPSDIGYVTHVDKIVRDAFPSLAIAKQHMAVWMRPAAVPECFKLYGTVNQDFKAGDTPVFIINREYPDSRLRKRVWITDWHQNGAGNYWGRWLMLGAGLALLTTVLILAIDYFENKHNAGATTSSTISRPLLSYV